MLLGRAAVPWDFPPVNSSPPLHLCLLATSAAISIPEASLELRLRDDMNEVSSQSAIALPLMSHAVEASSSSAVEVVEKLALENAVVIFSSSGCCMSHVVKRLLCGLGVNPVVFELDEEKNGPEIEKALGRFTGISQVSPTVFVGGKLIGGLDQVMAAHISGNLVPQLKEAGALWL